MSVMKRTFYTQVGFLYFCNIQLFKTGKLNEFAINYIHVMHKCCKDKTLSKVTIYNKLIFFYIITINTKILEFNNKKKFERERFRFNSSHAEKK